MSPSSNGRADASPLKGPGVEREEEAFEARQRGVGHVGPHAADHFVGRLADRPCLRPVADLLADGGEHRLGARLHGLHHRQEEPLPGSEVVQEHAVARAGGLGDAPQALVGQAVGGEVGDDRVEQALPGAGSGGLGFHMYQMVQSTPPEWHNR